MKTPVFRSSILAVVLVLAAGPASSRADMILDTLGTGYDPAGYLIADRPSFGYFAVAVRFQSPIDQQFTKAVIATSAFYYLDDNTNFMRALLIAGNESVPSSSTSSILEQFNFRSPWSASLITFNSVLRPTLTSGSTYWFAILPDWQTYGVWQYSKSVKTAPSNLAGIVTKGGPWGAFGLPEGAPEEAPVVQIEGAGMPVPSTLLWSGSVDGIWDVNTAANFSGGASGMFKDGDHVTFGDSGSNTTITIAAGGVAPGSIVFSNTTAKDYSLSGGPIKGATSLVVSGGGQVTLSSANTYTGGTVVSNGTLEIAGATALPAGKSLTIAVGGTVVLASGLSMGAAAAVPEPATLLLLGAAALAGLAAWRGTRRKKKPRETRRWRLWFGVSCHPPLPRIRQTGLRLREDLIDGESVLAAEVWILAGFRPIG